MIRLRDDKEGRNFALVVLFSVFGLVLLIFGEYYLSTSGEEEPKQQSTAAESSEYDVPTDVDFDQDDFDHEAAYIAQLKSHIQRLEESLSEQTSSPSPVFYGDDTDWKQYAYELERALREANEAMTANGFEWNVSLPEPPD